MSERKLATIRRIAELLPIKDADRIETARVDGWKVVVKKGDFQVGDLGVYFEIDSWIPDFVAPFLRRPGQPFKTYKGVDGQRLRTVRLKKQLSQGLLLPLQVAEDESGNPLRRFQEGDDLSIFFNINKWEPEIPAQLSGQVKGTFPSFIPKTDQERIQNCFDDMSHHIGLFEVTEKLDGSSMTVFVKHGEDGTKTGVCSRNQELVQDENNTFWKVALRDNLLEKLSLLHLSMALQGELIGPGIQGNRYNLTEHEFVVFDIYDINEQGYLSADKRDRICQTLGLRHVPIIGYMSMARFHNDNRIVPAWDLDGLLAYAEGKSLLADVEREGIVWKSLENPAISFKVINNAWLLKEKE